MEYLIGLLSGVVFFIALIGGIIIGIKLNNGTKHKPPSLGEKENNDLNKFNEDFQKLFSYDVAKATERKKV